MIDIQKGNCPYCVEMRQERVPIYAGFSLGGYGRILLCKEHFIELASEFKKFVDMEGLDLDDS